MPRGLTARAYHAVIRGMELSAPQRRALLAMCCVVARSDGDISASEYEQLLDLLSRMPGAVGFSELEDWVRSGPPPIDARLPEGCIKMFVREAIALARADGKVAEVELATIRDLVARHFEVPSA